MSSVKITLYHAKIRELQEAQIRALEKTAEALHTEVVQAQVMPRDTGALQNESTFVDYSKSGEGRVELISATPYARRLYFHPEYKFQTGENPNAKGRWLEDWLPGGKEEAFTQEAFNKLFKKEAGL
ncbi:MAG: hypothetical protein J6J86_05100 [Lachnospiraceae bacterium]|nr:hypothetical protein [Lachnospiraceae bacterium]